MNEQIKDIVVKDEILNSSVVLFCRFGFTKTTMEDLAKAAGKGKSTLYYYYKSKDEIFDAVIDKELREILADVYSAVSKVPTAAQKLRAYFRTFIGSTNKKSATLISEIMRSELIENNSIIEKAKKFIDVKEVDCIKEILKTGVKTGEFVEIPEKNMDHIAFALIKGVRTISGDIIITTDSFIEWQEPVEAMLDIIIRGLTA